MQYYFYFVTFTDDLSRYGYIHLMKHMSEIFEKFKEFQNEVENQLDGKIKHLHSDQPGWGWKLSKLVPEGNAMKDSVGKHP
jgi:hypothetical protein